MNDNHTSSSTGFFADFYHKHRIFSTLLIMTVITVFLGFFSLFFIDIWTNHGNTTTVPEVRKKSFSEALEVLKDAKLEVEIADSIYDTSLAPGQVKEVWPKPGARVKPGRTVYLTINSFQPQKITVSMPLTGVSSRQAITYLESLNIKNIRISYVPSNFPDLVEGAKYKGKSIVPGMQIPVTANVVLEVGKLKEGERPKATTETKKSDETETTEQPVDVDPEPSAEPAGPEPVAQPEKPKNEEPTTDPGIFD